MEDFATENYGYKYIITVIDAVAKFSWVYSLRHRNVKDFLYI